MLAFKGCIDANCKSLAKQSLQHEFFVRPKFSQDDKGFMELANQDPSAYLMIGSLAVLLLGTLLYGIYTAFGAGSVQLTDQIEEHSRLHKLGIAHSHQGQGRAIARPGHAHGNHDPIKF